MRLNHWLFVGLLCVAMGVLSSCADEGDPAKVVENYLQAQIEGDSGKIRDLLCLNLEGQVETLANSFAGLDAELRDMTCARGATDGDYTLVSCEGVIFINYGTENSEIPLETYRTIREDGEWRVCGEG